MPTPLYDTLRTYAARNPARFHMPGHSGAFLPAPELQPIAALDVTEVPGTGNLYEAGEPFDQAQALWAQAAGFESCQFLTGGSTMGLHTGLALLAPPGSAVLVDRGCHRSVFHAMALLDLKPVYLQRPWLPEENLVGPFSPEQVAKALDDHPDIKTVCITSPTYSGLLSDIEGIAGEVHRRGARLLVDGAHGAHLSFLGVDAFSGADCVVTSAHKTLPALGQGALLLTRGIEPGQVRRMAAVYGTSSPSYPIMASLDLARDWLQGEGGPAYAHTAEWVARLRERFPSLRPGPGMELDPCRFTLKVKDGLAFARTLEKRGIYPEMEDGGHVVFICTPCHPGEDLLRLEDALEEMTGEMGQCPPLPAPPLPQAVYTPRQALFAPVETLPLDRCEGRIAAAPLAPYPPGVPVVAPGEVIGKKELSYFAQIGYNNHSTAVLSEKCSFLSENSGRKWYVPVHHGGKK